MTTARPHLVDRAAAAAAWEWCVLFGVGALATLMTAYLEIGLRIPGHAILRAVVPIVFGMALVPRRGAGVVMTLGAASAATIVCGSGSGELPVATLAGLIIVGPLLDAAARVSRSGRGLYVWFSLVGVAANLIVFGVRWASTAFGSDPVGGGENFRRLGFTAFASFVACGALAGLIGAAVAFRPTSADRTGE